MHFSHDWHMAVATFPQTIKSGGKNELVYIWIRAELLYVTRDNLLYDFSPIRRVCYGMLTDAFKTQWNETDFKGLKIHF